MLSPIEQTAAARHGRRRLHRLLLRLALTLSLFILLICAGVYTFRLQSEIVQRGEFLGREAGMQILMSAQENPAFAIDPTCFPPHTFPTDLYGFRLAVHTGYRPASTSAGGVVMAYFIQTKCVPWPWQIGSLKAIALWNDAHTESCPLEVIATMQGWTTPAR